MWLAAVALQTLLLAASGGHVRAARRSMPVAALPMSKGGWRPVVGSGGFPGYSLLNGSPLQAPIYKIPVPVSADSFPASSKPSGTRDSSKLTSIAQSYKPTTLRSLPISNLNAPVNSYLNPFSMQNNAGLSHYKIVQNFPLESVIRNPNPGYAHRPIYKFPNQQNMNKYRQNQLHNAMLHQLSINNYHNMYPTTMRNPHDPFSKPVEVYVRPTEVAKRPGNHARPDGNNDQSLKPVEGNKKPEAYKVADSAGAQQSVKPQHVKTAQQALVAGTLKPPSSLPYQQYTFKEEKFSPIPPSILGSFGTFGFQSVKAKDPAFLGGTKTTYLPPAPTKHTVFNSFSFTPTLNNQDKFVITTPKVKPSPNQIIYGNTFANEFKSPQVQTIKQNIFKLENNNPNKGGFKASPQDPFAKPNTQPQYIHNQQQGNGYYFPSKLTQQYPQQFPQYYTTLPTTTAETNIFSTYPVPNRYISQLNPPHTTFTTFYGTQVKSEKEKKFFQSVSPTVSNQHDVSQYSVKPAKDYPIESTPNTVPFRATYDVTETYDIVTQPPLNGWLNSPEAYNSYRNQQQPTQQNEDPEIHEHHPEIHEHHPEEEPTKLPQTELPSQYPYATEPNEQNGYDNSLNYDTNVETLSRRPLGDDFEPNHISKHKLKDYYYKVTTPAYSSVESTTRHSDPEVTTYRNAVRDHIRGHDQSEQLPTLAPNRHFKRPQLNEPTEKEKVRRKNKNRRRRPTPSPLENDENEHGTTVLPIEVYTTEADGTVHTVRPRIRPVYGKLKSTTPTVTTDLSTSALPTVSPTAPTVIRKKLPGRRTTTFAPNDEEYFTVSSRVNDAVKGSSIMKINRQHNLRATTIPYDYSTIETPDYSHKQDEKDTPTSDIAVNISEDNKNSNVDNYKGFDFHVNVKPINSKLESYPATEKLEAARTENISQESNDSSKSVEVEKEESSEAVPTTTPKAEVSQLPGKLQRPRLKSNKYDNNRPRFSVKDYRNRLNSTTTTEKSHELSAPKLRFPQRRLPVYKDSISDSKFLIDNETTEAPRKKFTPKDPRHKSGSDSPTVDSTTEKQFYSTRISIRHKPVSSTESPEVLTPRISSRIRTNPRNSLRGKTSTTEEPLEQIHQAPVHLKRPLRKKQKDTLQDSLSEGSEDIVITESSTRVDHKEDTTSERYRSESAIMKIAKDEKKHQDSPEHSLSEHSKRVSDLTLAASKDYNTPGLFKTVSPNSRRIPNYFTIATDDPILPIEAFFPQLNQKKDS